MDQLDNLRGTREAPGRQERTIWTAWEAPGRQERINWTAWEAPGRQERINWTACKAPGRHQGEEAPGRLVAQDCRSNPGFGKAPDLFNF